MSIAERHPLNAGTQASHFAILVVEDNPAAASCLGQFLRSLGHEVRVCNDGGTAVAESVRRHPEVAFLDIGLPGYDGWEVARSIRRAAGGRPCFIVALTGFDDESDRERSRQAGINLHLRKPADPELLVDLLDKLAHAHIEGEYARRDSNPEPAA
jgi:CheY-like chemotaxis protein